jgi:alpha-N-arabinofuranosidase
MVFLAFRPQSGTYWHHLGRETFLAPVRWDAAGWPVVNEGKPIALDMRVSGLPARPVPPPPVRDELEGALGPAWTFLRNPVRASTSTTERPGWLTLHGTAVPLGAEKGPSPTYVGRRQQHLRARIAARIDYAPSGPRDEAGLVLYRAPHHRFELGVRQSGAAREVFLRQTVGPHLSAVTATAVAAGGEPLVLQIVAEPTRYTFFWAPGPDRLKRLGEAEPRLLATEVTGGFIGTFVGMYALAPAGGKGATAAFDWFDYEPQQ